MKEKYSVGLTAIWVIGSVTAVILQWDSASKMSLNEWGDFFAGVFSPIALLWLVLGYFQQGRELGLQVEELRRSVEQQKELVQATKDEVELSRSLHERQREKEDRDAQPKFVFTNIGNHTAPNKKMIWFHITNRGSHITDVYILPAQGECDPMFTAVMEHGGNFEVVIEKLTDPDEVSIDIQYVDSAERVRTQRMVFVLTVAGDYSPSAPVLLEPPNHSLKADGAHAPRL